MGNNSNQNLSLSDWITFLSGESNANISNILSLGALVLAACVIVTSTTHNNWAGIGGGIVMLLLLALAYIRLGTLFQGRSSKARELLNDITSGDNRDLAKIEQKWKDYLSKEKRTQEKWQKLTGKLAFWNTSLLRRKRR